MSRKPKNAGLPPFDEFAVTAVKAILARKPVSEKTGKKPAGVNVVTDNFNSIARKVYGDDFDVRGAIDELIKNDVLQGHPVRGGFRIYVYGEMPNSSGVKESDVLADLGLGHLA